MSENVEWIETDVGNVRYNPATETYRTIHQWKEGASLSTTISLALEAITGTRSYDLPPLFECCNPVALNRLFKPTGKVDVRRMDGRLVVPYADFHITIHADGEIVFRPQRSCGERSHTRDC